MPKKVYKYIYITTNVFTGSKYNTCQAPNENKSWIWGNQFCQWLATIRNYVLCCNSCKRMSSNEKDINYLVKISDTTHVSSKNLNHSGKCTIRSLSRRLGWFFFSRTPCGNTIFLSLIHQMNIIERKSQCSLTDSWQVQIHSKMNTDSSCTWYYKSCCLCFLPLIGKVNS